MKYRCSVCGDGAKKYQCELSSMDEDFPPVFCPFDDTNVKPVWKEVKDKKKQYGEFITPAKLEETNA